MRVIWLTFDSFFKAFLHLFAGQILYGPVYMDVMPSPLDQTVRKLVSKRCTKMSSLICMLRISYCFRNSDYIELLIFVKVWLKFQFKKAAGFLMGNGLAAACT